MEFSEIILASERIEKHINHTPVLRSGSLNKLFSCDLYFKCENFQKVGAFKFRGATNAVLSLNEEDLVNGVATHSSGNHAAALALAASNKGIPSYIVMPENSPEIKKEAVRGYGAEITFCQPTLQAREDTLRKVIEEKGAMEIHPYNNFSVIAGQGTAAKEFIEECPDLDFILCPVGGGGLLSGTSISAKAMSPLIKVIACEPLGANDAYYSFYSDKIHPSESPKTIADGLLTSLGTLTYPIIKKNVDAVVTVSEENIINAMRLIWERMKIIIEPSSAVPLAALLENKISNVSGKKVGIIISGGNVDLGAMWSSLNTRING